MKNFKSTPEVYAKAPGRINFIGEHVDYQEGIVLPSAINKYIYAVAARLEKPIVRLCSTYNEEKIIEKVPNINIRNPHSFNLT